MATPTIESVQCFGNKKTSMAMTYCKRGQGLINDCPIELVEPEGYDCDITLRDIMI
ncbi:unnamed protein product [Prunus armeniaca]|uniref:Uncharacterized protein n=1 Tax=Prunus armeniaca TaxID=36596 RepID=A0A6J5YB97_PRUAR|nr:unnamed protein product [Prunus armeniaca]